MFVMFGVVLYYAKGADFFFDVAAAISGGKPGGPAKVAVVSSGLFGMVSGSPTADVVTTGSVTIPAMKRLGYGAAVAGAVETAASTGGSLMPPVMGSAAFLMAEYTGIPYRDIAFAALLPALLFYLCVYAQVHFRAVRLRLAGLEPHEIPKLGAALKQGSMFFVPLTVLTVSLLYGFTPTMVAIFGTISIIVISWFRRDTRLGPLELWNALAETTFRMVPVAGATAAAGLVIAGITMTGLAAKFAHIIYAMTDANQFMTLLVGAALTIVLGCGMPTPSAYILAAVLMGPLMTQLGVEVLAGQMFLLYFAVMSAITPPVAVAAYAASSIAEANPITIAGHAVKLALAAFVVPFVFVFGPELLWKGPLWKTALTFGTAAIGLVLLAGAIERYAKWADSWWSRVMLGVGAILMITPNTWLTATGVALAACAIAANRLRERAIA
jgi:TRAP transporter 4TM/12TM fusion protein